MANVGSGDAGKTLIGAGNGKSPTYASIGTNSGLTAHGVVVAENLGAFTALSPSATAGIPLVSNGSSADPSFTTAVVAGGGTGQTTFPAHSILIGAVASPIGSLSPGAAGTLVRSTGASSDPGYTTATYPTTSGSSGNLITSNGTNFVSVAPQASSKITTYNASSTWTIDPRAISVEFYVMSGGGGGGSGRSGVSASAGGGAGGGPGNLYYLKALASLLVSSPYTITVGGAGSGGSLVNGVGVNGNPGIIGGTSSVGTLIVVLGGTGGAGGTTGSGTGGNATFINMHQGVNSITQPLLGGNGSNGQASATVTSPIYGWATGGGGGSGYTSATPRTGAAGGSILAGDGSVLVAGGLAGANTGATAGDGNPPTGIQLMLGGTGGGGGGNDGTVTAGNGGNGAVPGGGGGGGGGNLSSNNSGAGGNGAAGQIIIIEYF